MNQSEKEGVRSFERELQLALFVLDRGVLMDCHWRRWRGEKERERPPPRSTVSVEFRRGTECKCVCDT